MDDIMVEVKLDGKDACIPEFKTDGSAGADIVATSSAVIEPGDTKMIHTGIHTKFNENYVALIYARSGLASKHGIAPANKVCVIDADYRGEWMIPLYNQSDEDYVVNVGDRIAQVIFHKVERPTFHTVDELEESDRGEGGFGSTGK